MGVDLHVFWKLRGSISLPSPFPPSLPSLPLPFPAAKRPPQIQLGIWSAVSSPSGVRGRAPAANAFWVHLEPKIASDGSSVTSDMSHNHSLIINIHWHWQRLCSLCFITVLQTFCEGPNNGGPSLAKFHEGPDPRTLAGSTPMLVSCSCPA